MTIDPSHDSCEPSLDSEPLAPGFRLKPCLLGPRLVFGDDPQPPLTACGGIKPAYRARCSPLVFEDEPPAIIASPVTLRVTPSFFDQRVNQDFTVRKLEWD